MLVLHIADHPCDTGKARREGRVLRTLCGLQRLPREYRYFEFRTCMTCRKIDERLAIELEETRRVRWWM